jgi:hypothetical protein
MGKAKNETQTSPPKPRTGPHAAIGTIDYGDNEKGYIVYIKSSLSGDENDYIRDYARRYDRFPHETTGDQFFSEEQFEVYRALGFHMAHGLLGERDSVSVIGETRELTFKDVSNPVVQTVRAMIMPDGDGASGGEAGAAATRS